MVLSRGQIFDLGVFGANMWLAASLAELARADSLAWAALLLVCGPLYCLGASLKRQPLHLRLSARHTPPVPTWAWITLFVLMVMQMGFFLICVTFGLELLSEKVSRPPGPEWLYDTLFMILLIGGFLPPSYTIRALMAPGKPGAVWRGQEPVADLLLYVVTLVAMTLWSTFLVEPMNLSAIQHPAMKVLFMTLMTVPFAIFYASPRLLFLAEDWRSPGAWLGMALAMSPLAYRLWF